MKTSEAGAISLLFYVGSISLSAVGFPELSRSSCGEKKCLGGHSGLRRRNVEASGVLLCKE